MPGGAGRGRRRGYAHGRRASRLPSGVHRSVVTREGIPLSYEVFDGNRVDVTTVKEIAGTMEARFGLAGRISVMDRGMMSRKNLAWLQQSNRRYVLGGSRSEVKRWSAAFAEEQGFQVVREGVEVKLCSGGVGELRSVSGRMTGGRRKLRCTNGSRSASSKVVATFPC